MTPRRLLRKPPPPAHAVGTLHNCWRLIRLRTLRLCDGCTTCLWPGDAVWYQLVWTMQMKRAEQQYRCRRCGSEEAA